MVTNGKLIADPHTVKFEKSDGSVVVEGDLLDLMNGIYETGKDGQGLHEHVLAYRAWLEAKFSEPDKPMKLGTSQAHAIYMQVNDEFERFKKKFEAPSKSPDTLASTLAASTVE